MVPTFITQEGISHLLDRETTGAVSDQPGHGMNIRDVFPVSLSCFSQPWCCIFQRVNVPIKIRLNYSIFNMERNNQRFKAKLKTFQFYAKKLNICVKANQRSWCHLTLVFKSPYNSKLKARKMASRIIIILDKVLSHH